MIEIQKEFYLEVYTMGVCLVVFRNLTLSPNFSSSFFFCS